jgi:hypothetical protein
MPRTHPKGNTVNPRENRQIHGSIQIPLRCRVKRRLLDIGTEAAVGAEAGVRRQAEDMGGIEKRVRSIMARKSCLSLCRF